jgi:hypothetical protein
VLGEKQNVSPIPPSAPPNPAAVSVAMAVKIRGTTGIKTIKSRINSLVFSLIINGRGRKETKERKRIDEIKIRSLVKRTRKEAEGIRRALTKRTGRKGSQRT